MKKFLVLILALVLFLSVTMLSACQNPDGILPGDLTAKELFKNVQMKEVYSIYLDYMEEMGEEPLSFEEWFEAVNGDEFTEEIIPQIQMNEESGYWEISYNNGNGWNRLHFKTQTEAQKDCKHHYNTWVTLCEGNDYFNGIRYRECKSCQYKEYDFKLNHKYTATTVEPTCSEEGYTLYTCSDCDHTYTEVHPKVDHNWVQISVTQGCEFDTIEEQCSACQTSRTYQVAGSLGHAYTKVVTPATCTSQGYTTYTCECGDSYVEDWTEKVDHSMGEWVEVTSKTCETDGLERSDCQNTECDHYETRPIPAPGHKPGSTQKENNVDPTCTVDGHYEEVVYCTVCKDELSRETITITAPGHKPGEAKIENKVDPTCTVDGHYEEVVYCTVCKVELSRETITITAPGHKPGEVKIENRTEPTCTVNGQYDEVVYCTVCKKELSRNHVTISALGHDYGTWYTTKESTCKDFGEKRRDCKRCDGYDTREISKKPHAFDEWTVLNEATCTMGGVSEATCAECGFVNKKYSNPLNHDYVWSDYRKPTCNQDGYNLYICQREGCGEEKRQLIPFTGHQYDENGNCTVCGNNQEFCNHDFVIVVVTPTCTTYGYTEYTCKDCGYVKRTNITSNSVHKWGNGEVITEKTCTSNGLRRYTCSECGAVRNDIISASHSYVTTDYISSDCTNTGMRYEECRECGETQETVIPASHSFGGKITIQSPTCDKGGIFESVCTRCNETHQISTAKLGHAFIDGVCELCQVSYMDVIIADTEDDMYGMHFDISSIISNYGPGSVNQFGVFLDYNPEATITKVAILLVQEGSVWRRTIVCVGADLTYANYVPYLAYNNQILYSGLNCDWIHTFALSEQAHGIWSYSDYVTITVNFEDQYGELIQYIYGIERTGAETRVFDNLGELITWVGICESHIESDWIVDRAETCTEFGHKYKICKACKAVINEENIKPLGHDAVFHEGKKETCTEDGWTAYETCTRCNHNTKVIIPKTGHDLKEVEAKAPDCENYGWEAYVECQNDGCTYSTYKQLPALGHKMGEWQVTTSATCEEDGVETRRCQREGCYHFETRPTNSIGHNMGNWEETTPATCEEGGEETQRCQREGCDYFETQDTDPLGHNMGNWEETTPATCGEGGEETQRCQREGCDHFKTRPTNPLGHSMGKWEVTTPATCGEGGEETQRCQREGCDYFETRPTNPLGHNMGKWVESTPPTCCEEGERYRQCQNKGCTYREDEVLPTTDHVPGEWEMIIEASCTNDGVKGKKCIHCEICIISQVITAKGHAFSAWKTISEASCQKTGTRERSCQCGTKETVTIAKKQHVYIDDDNPNTLNLLEQKCKNCSQTRAISKEADVSSLVTTIHANPKTFELLVTGVSSNAIKSSLTITDTRREKLYGDDSADKYIDFSVVHVSGNTYKIVPNGSYEYSVTYRIHVGNGASFVSYYCTELTVIMEDAPSTGDDGDKKTEYNDIKDLTPYYDNVVVISSSDTGLTLLVPPGSSIDLNLFSLYKTWNLGCLNSSMGVFGNVANIFRHSSGGTCIEFTPSSLFDIFKQFGSMDEFDLDLKQLEDQWASTQENIEANLYDNLVANEGFLAFLDIADRSLEVYLGELGIKKGSVDKDNLKIKPHIEIISYNAIKVTLTVDLEIPVISKNGQDVGNICISLKYENISKFSIDPSISFFEDALITASFDIIQTGNDNVELNVKFDFLEPLTENEKKDYAINKNTNTVHRSTCVYVTKTSNDSNFSYYTEAEIKNYLDGNHFCTLCKPHDVNAFSVSYVAKVDSNILHRPNCIYIGTGSNVVTVSPEDYGKYELCTRCKLAALNENSFEIRLLNDLQYADWDAVISKVQNWKKDSGSSMLLDSILSALAGKSDTTQEKDIRLGGCKATVYEIIELKFELYLTLQIDLQATFQYKGERENFKNILTIEMHCGKNILRPLYTDVHISSVAPTYREDHYMLAGKFELQAGFKFSGSIVIGKTLTVEVTYGLGVYMNVSGVFTESIVTDTNGSSYGDPDDPTKHIHSSKLEIGQYVEYTLSVHYLFAKLQIIGEIERNPSYIQGFDKVYYSYPEMDTNWVINDEKDLSDVTIPVEYFDLSNYELQLKKRVENLALITSAYSSNYTVHFEFASGEYLYISNGKIHIRDSAPHQFTDVLYITFEGSDSFYGQYKYGSVGFHLPAFVVYIKGYNHNYGEGVVTTESTCKTSGIMTYTCSCGHQKHELIEKKPHAVNTVDLAATCTTDGFSGRQICTQCNDILYEGKTISATGHNFDKNFTIDTAPTCKSTGEKSKHCANCEERDEITSSPMSEHDYGAENVCEKTCTTNGYCYKICSFCGDVYQYNIDYAVGHQEYVIIVVAPTCTARGYTEYGCQVCTHTEKRNYQSATGHKYGEWFVYEEATCTNVGEERRYCENSNACGYYQTRVLSKLRHEYNAVVTAPTCTAKGYTTYTCKCGDHYVGNYTDMIEHTYIDGVCVCGDTNLSVTPDEYFTFTLLNDGTYSIAAANKSGMPNQIGIPSTYNGKAVSTIAAYAFQNCSNIKVVSIPDSIKRIENYAFYYCTALTRITFQQGSELISIGESAFYNCYNLKAITIPANIKTIGSGAFNACSSLHDVYYLGDVAGWCSISFGIGGNFATAHPLNAKGNLYIGGELVVDLVIPEGITSIPAYAFYQCTSIQSVTIPASVKTIGEYAFYGCTSNKNVTLADGSRLACIYSYAFSENKLLTTITLPASCYNISNGVFGNCINLESIYYLGNIASWCNNTFGGRVIPNTTTKLYIEGILVENLVIPNGVTSIANYAFDNYGYLKTVTFGADSNLVSIGGYAFQNCINLTQITLPQSIKTISNYAFNGCHKVTSVEYLGSVNDWMRIIQRIR